MVPYVSVLLPGWNEGENIFRAINSLQKQTFTDFNVFLILGGKEEEISKAKDYIEKQGLTQFIILKQEIPNKNRALNKALSHPEIGDILILSDVDCEFPPNYIETYVEDFKRHPEKNVIAGRCQPFKKNANFIERYLRNNEERRMERLPPVGEHLIGANFAVRRSFLESTIKQFDENTLSSTDAHFVSQMRELKEPIYLNKDSIVYSDFNTDNLKGFIKQQSRWIKNVFHYGWNFKTKKSFLVQLILALFNWYVFIIGPIAYYLNIKYLHFPWISFLLIGSWTIIFLYLYYKHYKDLIRDKKNFIGKLTQLIPALAMMILMGIVQIIASLRALFTRNLSKSWKETT